MIDLRELYQDIEKYIDKEITIKGWIRRHRKQKEFGFIDFSDGTSFKHLQVVYNKNTQDFEKIDSLKHGSSIAVIGRLVKSEGAGQDYEVQASSITLEGDCSDDYPLQPKQHSREFLREISYLRPRANLFQAVFRVRSIAAMAIHTYFQERGYVYLHAPLITASDCEGAGEMFQVTTLDLDKVASNGKVDYSKDF
ncbi:MAG: OB-fold nucleic acid binding domain-containing protein, partial [bacterium]|nr:OB-fold nucleic acid binding domain-containing protein [bacterium]